MDIFYDFGVHPCHATNGNMDAAAERTGEALAATTTGANAHPSASGLVHRAGSSDVPSYLPEPVPDTEAGVHQAPAKACCGKAEAASSTAADSDGSSRFICHICLNSPDKPVVTVCGHLYW
jgi:hypothetical protein